MITITIVFIYPSRFGMQLEDEPTVVKTWAEFAGLLGTSTRGHCTASPTIFRQPLLFVVLLRTFETSMGFLINTMNIAN